MRKSKHWLTFLFLGIVLQAKSQLNTQFYFRHLSTEDGFTQSENTYFFQDAYGLTWINSREGLNVYNSQKIKTFTQLPDRTITSPCFEDRNHNIWFSTQSAIYCYQRKLDKFASYTIQEAKKTNSELSYQAFHFDANDHLWLQVKKGDNCQLYQFHLPTHSFKSFYSMPSGQCNVVLDPSKKVKQIIVANSQGDHGFWLIDAKNGIRKKKEFHFNSKKKTKAVEENWYVASIYPEGDSLIWFGLYGCVGLYHFKTDTAIAIRNYGKNIHYDGEMVGEIVSIQAYNKKYLLLSTGQSGLIFFNKEKLLFENQTLVDSNIENGLKSNSLGESYLDNHQNIWLIENNRSIAFANLRPFQFKQIPSLYKKNVNSIYEDLNHNIWCSTLDSGIYVFNLNRTLLFHQTKMDNKVSPKEFTLPPISSFFEPNKSELWGIYTSNLLRWDNVKKIFVFQLSYYLDIFNNINYAYQTKEGKSLAAINNSIYQIDFSKNQFDTTKFLNFPNLKSQQIRAFHQDTKDFFYISDTYNRLMIVQVINGRINPIKTFDNLGECYDFHEAIQEEKLWIATSQGLMVLDLQSLWKNGKNTPSSALKNIQALPSISYYSVLPDRQDNLWLSSSNGILQYNTRNNQVYHFGKSDGLQGMAFNQGAFLQASNGEIWMGGADGVNVFHPDSIRHKTDFPRILIENIKINDVNNNFKQNVQLLNQLPRLKYNENTLSFDFLALEYNNPESIQFKYRLTGQDTAWVMANNPGFIRFSKLPAGAYTLELIATNSDGVWKPAEMAKKVSFYIPLPWWRTWWFFLLCIVLVGAAVYGIVAYRFEQALKIERMRVRISSDLHDDVGTILTGLAMQSEILELTANETTKPKLQRISELSRSAMSHMRDTVWAIDARKDKLENLLDRMREHAEETLTPKGIAFDFQVDQLALHKNVPSHFRRNLYLIYKEAITNIAKHSNGSAVHVQLQKIEATGLEMRIHDNGVPLQKEYKTTGVGLANMRMRAEQIGATIQLDTSSSFLIIIHLPRIS